MQKLLLIIILVVIVAVGVYRLFPRRNFDIIPEQAEIIETLSFGNFLKANYSFSTDTDLDGLSDAKEIIYGSDPLVADTDGDGFLDGQEVQNGFDPVVGGKGEGLLSEREHPSLTVQYFAWLKEKTGDPDPQLSQERIKEFLTEHGLLDFSLPVVLDSEITFTNDDVQKIADYLTVTTSLALPEEGSPYLALAGELLKNRSFTILHNLLENVTNGVNRLETLQVPAKAGELHRSYLGVWRELQTLFEGLRFVQEDPVLIFLNQRKGEWLAEKINEAERLRAQMIAEVKLLPFQQSPQLSE